MKVLLFGITGLVGSVTATLLVKSFQKIVAPVRRPLLGDFGISVQCPVISFENFSSPENTAVFEGADCVIYCLGTTLKRAGSVAEFCRIEWTLATQVASAAKKMGVRRFVLLSAAGANPKSLIPYNRIKGEIERFAQELGFQELVIAKPSLLVGDRAETRALEGISVKFSQPLLRPLQKFVPRFAPIQDLQVAKALVHLATASQKKRVLVAENADLLQISGPALLNVIDL